MSPRSGDDRGRSRVKGRSRETFLSYLLLERFDGPSLPLLPAWSSFRLPRVSAPFRAECSTNVRGDGAHVNYPREVLICRCYRRHVHTPADYFPIRGFPREGRSLERGFLILLSTRIPKRSENSIDFI